jgi:hypothetical protein
MNMRHEQLVSYIKLTESMILPEQVARVNQASGFLRKLPLKLQKRIATRGSVKNPYMGFVVEPFSFFLSYELRDPAAASRLLPAGYRLVPVSMFEGERPRLAAILGAFNIHTSVFWGSRLELYLIAENEKTGRMSWIIAEYETNTNSYDPGQGFTGSTTAHSVVTTSYAGEVIVDVRGRKSGSRLSLTAAIEGAPRHGLNQRLWVEGNLSVDYGGSLDAGDTQPFGLIFDPAEMKSALKVPLGGLSIEENTLGSAYLSERPFEAACFPYAQHFITTSMPKDIGLGSAEELEEAVARFSSTRGGGTPLMTGLNAALIG